MTKEDTTLRFDINVNVDSVQLKTELVSLFEEKFAALEDFFMALTQQEMDALANLNAHVDAIDARVQDAIDRATASTADMTAQISGLSTQITDLQAMASQLLSEDEAEDAAFLAQINAMQATITELQQSNEMHATEVVDALNAVEANLDEVDADFPADAPPETEPPA